MFKKNSKFQTLEPATLPLPNLTQISSFFHHISTCHYSLITQTSFFLKLNFSPNSSMAERPQRRARTKHTAPRRSSPSRPPSKDFKSLHFSNDTSVQRFRDKFMGKPVTPSFSLNILEFSDITICGHSITQFLSHWKEALSIEEPIYENLVRIFYSNMELSSTRRVALSTYVGGFRIEIDEPELCSILGISYRGLDIYTAKKELDFSDFRHVDAVRNICRRRELFDDVCSLSFRSQLLPFPSSNTSYHSPTHGHS